jgi:hypothetical protein
MRAVVSNGASLLAGMLKAMYDILLLVRFRRLRASEMNEQRWGPSTQSMVNVNWDAPVPTSRFTHRCLPSSW